MVLQALLEVQAEQVVQAQLLQFQGKEVALSLPRVVVRAAEGQALPQRIQATRVQEAEAAVVPIMLVVQAHMLVVVADKAKLALII